MNATTRGVSRETPHDGKGIDTESHESAESAPTGRRSLDTSETRAVAFDGGTAILARTYRQLPSGVEIETGEAPVAVAGVYSYTDIRRALGNYFDAAAVDHALAVELTGPSAPRAVSCAEREAGHAEVL